MSRILIVSVILSFLAPVLTPLAKAEEWQWRSLTQVEHIALVAQLAEYPFPHDRLHSVLGKPKLPHLGGSWDDRDRQYNIFALTDPQASGGYYAVRVVYGDLDSLPKPEEIPIVEVQVLFQVRSGLSFIHEPQRGLKRLLPELRKSMKEKGVPPIAYAESFLGTMISPEEEKAPNQPPQTTTGSSAPGRV